MIKYLLLSIGLLISNQGMSAELLYFYDEFCGACQKFDDEVGQFYENTDESKLIPIRKVQFSKWRKLKDAPYQNTIATRVIGTPTFVMIEAGKEVDRLVGYSNSELFWLSFTTMQNKLPEY